MSMLALIAGAVSYLHMHELVALNGQPGWVAALTPLSVDGMIVSAWDSGRRVGVIAAELGLIRAVLGTG